MTQSLKPPSDEPAIRVVMMPRDTNAEGTIFGGVILSLIDQAAYVEALRQAHRRYVTVAMDKIVFSSTLEAPLTWANTRLVSEDAVEVVRGMKQDGDIKVYTEVLAQYKEAQPDIDLPTRPQLPTQ